MSSGPVSGAGVGRFDRAAGAVGERLMFVRFTGALRRTAVPVFAAALVLAVVVVLAGWVRHELLWAAGVVGGWLLGCWLYAVAGRSGPFAELAAWDEAAGRGEMFASAWSFEHRAAGAVPDSAGAALHLERSRDALDGALDSLRRDLPLGRLGWRVLLPAALLAFAASPWGKPAAPAWEQPMSDAAREEAAVQAEEIADATGALDGMDGLEPDEKEQLDALREAIESTAEELAKAGGQTAEDALDALEARAREAEDLADELGAADGEWASDALLEALGQHADTTDLADAIRDKDAGASASESEEIAEKLRDPDLTAEVRDRFDTTLGDAADSADDQDLRRPVGKHVAAASEALQKRAAPAAGAEFAELAKHFQALEEREKAREALDALADALRQAGSDLAGQGGGGMEQLAGTEGEGAGRGDGTLSQALQPLDGSEGPGSPQSMPMSAPGMDSLQPGSSGQQGNQGQGTMSMGTGTPVPGEAGEGEGMALVPGESPGEGGKFALLPAPVPGTTPQGTVAVAAPVPGAGAPSGSMAMAGGLEAGNGSAELGESPDQALTAASQQGNVAAQVNADGESSTRAVEGSPRHELATRSRREVAAEFLGVQEDALDEQALPPSRREQVKRYFRAIRRSFEGGD